MKRLSILLMLIGLSLSCKQAPSYPPLLENTAALQAPEQAPFYHGVASGDPQADKVIIWTRVTPPTHMPEISVNWEIAKDEGFKAKVSEGKFLTGPKGIIQSKLI